MIDTFTSPFVKLLRLKVTELQNGYYSIIALHDDGLISPPESWVPQLFYKYEANFYGLTVPLDERDITLSTAELLDVLSPSLKHPLLHIVGADVASEVLFEIFRQLVPQWTSSTLWQAASFNEQKLQFELDEGQILATAATQKLINNGLQLEQVKELIPFFTNGGWPLQSEHHADDLKVALRLSEPDEVSEQWLLETIIITPTEKHWTPAIRKRWLPIAEALPEKWKAFSADIAAIQQQIATLLPLDNLTSESFIYHPLTDEQVKLFLRNDIAVLQALGYEIILPAWLKELKQSKMRVQVSAGQLSTRSVAGLDDILTFKWQFSMNGENISAEQFQKLVDEKREFMRIGTEWFRIDAAWMQEMRALMDKASNEQWTVKELLFRELPETLTAPAEEFDEDDAERDDPILAFEIQQSLQNYLQQLQEKQGLPSVPVPLQLEADLRPYQQQGFEWLVFMREQKFGACLADDMGLGKTIQTISYLLHTINTLDVTEPAIIICPTSVLGNWQKELARFAPSLSVYTHYGANRLKDDALLAEMKRTKPQIVVSTYGTISQDVEFLQHLNWSSIILDEAQNIKNMQTIQSRAIRRLRGEHHIALTGTPVENRLSELWAIFDFIHKGYLGSFGKFQEQFILPIERDDSEQYKEQLRAKIQPFLLRRTKRDSDLMLNLPDKQEIQEFCPLTAEQAALYESYIEDTAAQLEQLTGFEKRGRILKMLNKLKQLCNHPALYLKEPFDDAETLLSRSVKLRRIVDLTAEIVHNGEQCLIFTQYIGMGNILQHCFAELYNIDAPFLTGSMPKQQRDRLVEAFQAGEFPIFILSLKAGGTGLNLTAANHVLHADRWWNPAVENQATDRAYRIGQTQFVQVHKFITIGTIEEKIDKMLTIKSALSEELIQSSKWLTELQDDELRELFTLDMVK
ncbi:DEAD/DEAH box helicase [Metasolibacillus meyeri]|uniref:DEAD/DEAH box helicase n=1 Tax=Metasolibacillus meyeri TaxID=1071052 RepID=A0AAW9NQY4_9BACL|nr:DEAD/DEAH box helicase [Metasolibacillus meyeri]MEC1177729.1 DEAD/DEAH box helicase [Metasolibacillus meyeri]